MSAWDFDELTKDLQDCAVHPERWTEVLGRVSDGVDGAGTILFGMSGRVGPPPASANKEESVAAYMSEGWYRRDERFAGAGTLLRKGIVTDHDILSDDDMKSSTFYNEFLHRHGMERFAGIGFLAGQDLWCLSVQRRIEDGAFQSSEIAKLKALWRPLSDTATLSRQLDASRTAGMTDALDFVGHASALLDHSGRILKCNENADALIGTMIDPGAATLVFGDRDSADAYGAAVGKALDRIPSSDHQPHTAVVADKSGQRLLIRAVGLVGDASLIFSQARVLLLIRSLDVTPDTKILQNLGLSPAERRFAQQILAGRSVAAASKELFISEETGRSHLKSLFRKTKTHRQGEFIALVARLRTPADM